MHIGRTIYRVWVELTEVGQFCMHAGQSRRRAREEYRKYVETFGASRVEWEENFE